MIYNIYAKNKTTILKILSVLSSNYHVLSTHYLKKTYNLCSVNIKKKKNRCPFHVLVRVRSYSMPKGKNVNASILILIRKFS